MCTSHHTPSLLAITGILLALSLPTIVFAQSEEHSRPFAIKLGALFSGRGTADYFPQPNGTITSNTEPLLGITFEIPARQKWLPINYGLYYDDIRSHSRRGGVVRGATGSGYGIGIQGRYQLGKAKQPVAPYFGIGLGEYKLDK